MTLSGLVLRNVARHPVRSGMIVVFSALSIALGTFLISVLTTFSEAVKQASSRRLTVQSAVSLFAELPASYRVAIESTPGVASVGRWSWFGGYFRDPQEFFPSIAVDFDTLFSDYADIVVPAEQRAAILKDRTSCLVGEGLAKRFGFRVGDSVPLVGTQYPGPNGEPWHFTVRGIYRPREGFFSDGVFFLHWDLLEESRRATRDPASRAGYVTFFMVGVDARFDAVEVASAIDARYAGGPTRTHTQTEAAFRAERVGTLGNVVGFLGSIGAVVMLALLLSVGNAMGIAASERAREVGILKALGFRDGVAARLVLSESVLLVGGGGVLGCAVARALAPLARRGMSGVLPSFDVLPRTLALGVGVAVAVALLGALPPALRTARVRALDVLRSEG